MNRNEFLDPTPWDDIDSARHGEYPAAPPDAYPVPEPQFQLTPGQQAALDALVAAILDPGMRRYKALLEGWAGTGKTFTINRVVEEVRKADKRISFGMTAPTHKAVRQLRKHSELKDQLDFGTIHSFLGLKEVLKPDPRDPHKQIVKYELEWNAKQERRIDTIDVLIVDESSMLGDELYGHIDDVCRMNTDLKVIFMGDSLQIPPVGKKQETGVADAIPFVAEQRKSRVIEHFVLSEIVRQKGGNPIIEYSSQIRTDFRKQVIGYKYQELGQLGELHPDSEGVVVLRKENGIKPLRELFSRYFDTDAFRADSDYVKVIAWRNATVDYFNREIRLLINHADVLPKIIEGEKMILDKPVLKGEKILLPNNEEIEVSTVRVVDYPIKYKYINPSAFQQLQSSDSTDPMKDYVEKMFKTYECIATTSEGKEHLIRILHEDSEQDYEITRKSLETAAKTLSRNGMIFESKDMWKEFYKMEKLFAWVKYNYCLTAHKAQGSTYEYCISMEWDIEQNRDIEERNRIRYVAATRARKKLFIVK